MIERFLLGLRTFYSDVRYSLPLTLTFILALGAFVLAFAVASGFHF